MMSKAIPLFYREFGQEHETTFIILHGLFGMSDNWVTMAKKFAANFHVIIPDLRNHGQSPHTEDFSYELMAQDIIALMDEKGVSSAHIMGHSMGGKLLMHLAFDYPERLYHIIIADMSMRAGEFREIHASIMDAIAKTKMEEFTSYSQLQTHLERFISSRKIILFVMKNIKKTPDNTFQWKLNYNSLYQNTHKIMEEVLPSEPFEKPCLLLRGEKSDYVSDEDFEEIKMAFPKAELQTLPDASHWLHADKPKLFYNSCLNFLLH